MHSGFNRLPKTQSGTALHFRISSGNTLGCSESFRRCSGMGSGKLRAACSRTTRLRRLSPRKWQLLLLAMKRSPLKRKSSLRDSYAAKCRTQGVKGGLKRNGKLKTTRLGKVSVNRGKQLAEYSKIRGKYLFFYAACVARIREVCARGATDVHHQRGKVGRLLCDTRFFLPVCRGCHDWIHQHPNRARELGLIAPASEWEVYPE